MKRWIALIMSMVMVLSLVACGSNASNGTSEEGSGSAKLDDAAVVALLCEQGWKEMNVGATTLTFFSDGSGMIDNGYLKLTTAWGIEGQTVTVQYDYSGVKTAVFQLQQIDGFWRLDSESGTALYVQEDQYDAAYAHIFRDNSAETSK